MMDNWPIPSAHASFNNTCKDKAFQHSLPCIPQIAVICATVWLWSIILIPTQTAFSQSSFDELKESEAYRKIELAPPPQKRHSNKGSPTTILSNYDSLWRSARGSHLLLQWVEARIPRHQLELRTTGIRSDHVVVEASLRNHDKVEVDLTIQVPKPEYKTMAELKTLLSFNQFRPPSLEIVGSQKAVLHGVEVDYYRIKDGSCSVVIPIEQHGIINLRVRQCTNSTAMFTVAKSLNLTRLNQKLTS